MSKPEEGLRGRYIDSRYQTALAFGQTSPYIMPWRAYQETLPTFALTNALGVHLNLGDAAPEPVLRHLAACGVRHGRIEIGWGNAFEDDAETTLTQASRDGLRPLLLACRGNDVRPLVLLNAHHGVPVPMVNAQKTLARAARKGDRVAYLSDTGDLKRYRSGFNNVLQYKAVEVMFTEIAADGEVVLSRPLPKDLGDAGKTVTVGTLRYLPFGFPDPAENAKTRNAWKRYVLAVARFAAQTLTPLGFGDRGFDMEIWNELSFGSDFVQVTNYFDPVPFPAPKETWGDIVRATAEVAVANAGTFGGVRLCDGFANTIPWTAASQEPARVTALSKHPYSSLREYDGTPPGGDVVNALLVAEPKPHFYPRYRIAFPEYFANALQTEHVIRDLSPITTDLYGTKHGRFARAALDRAKPFRVWFTEWGVVPKEWGVSGREAALHLKARAYLRIFVFMVGKGLERLYFYAARGEDVALGMASERFIEYAVKKRQFPSGDAKYRSPVLATLKRLLDAVSGDPNLRETRPLVVEDIRDTHGHFQWRGDGSPAHPALYNRECFVLLPFQQTQSSFVLMCYIQTRDMTKSLPPERYTVILSGFAYPENVRITRYFDPVSGKNVPDARVLRSDGLGRVFLSLPVVDYPWLLFLSDAT